MTWKEPSAPLSRATSQAAMAWVPPEPPSFIAKALDVDIKEGVRAARAMAARATIRKILTDANSIYADNERMQQIVLAFVLATNFGEFDGERTFVPMPPMKMPKGGCWEGYHGKIVNHVSMCLADPQGSPEEGISWFLSHADLQPQAYEGSFLDLLHALQHDSDLIHASESDWARIAFQLADALKYERSLGIDVLWDVPQEQIDQWRKGRFDLAPTEETYPHDTPTTLPAEQRERIQAALAALEAAWPADWPGEQKEALLPALATIGLTLSNFGRVRAESNDGPIDYETNNWLKLGALDKDAADCDVGDVYIADDRRCVHLLETVASGVDYFFASISDPKAEPLRRALVSKDIGKLAAGLMDSGYLYPIVATRENWESLRNVLSLDLGAVEGAMGKPSSWTISNFTPDYPSVTVVDKPTRTDTDSTNEGNSWTSGQKIAAAVGSLALIGLVAASLSRRSAPVPPSSPPDSGQPLSSNPIQPVDSPDPSELKAARSSSDPGWHWHLVRSPSETIRLALAENDHLGFDVLAVLAQDPSPRVQHAAYSTIAMRADDPAWLRWLAQSQDKTIILSLASNPHLPPDVLSKLSWSTNPTVRSAVAKRALLPAEAQERLVQDGTKEVRRHLAFNPSILPHLLDRLIRDEDESVQVQAMQHPQAHLDLINRQRFESSSEYVREEAAHILSVRGHLSKSALPIPGETIDGKATPRSELVEQLTAIYKVAKTAAERASQSVTDEGMDNDDKVLMHGKSGNKANMDAAQAAGFSIRKGRGQFFILPPVPSRAQRNTVQAQAIVDNLRTFGIFDAWVEYTHILAVPWGERYFRSQTEKHG